MKTKITASILVLAMLSGCAGYRPVVDTRGVDMNAYNADLKDCQGFAEQRDAGTAAAGGAAAGAIFGALLGAAIGGRAGAGMGAKIGVVQGVGTGAAYGAGSQVAIVKNCMAGRGYRVLQ
jgi:hypothetical protein